MDNTGGLGVVRWITERRLAEENWRTWLLAELEAVLARSGEVAVGEPLVYRADPEAFPHSSVLRPDEPAELWVAEVDVIDGQAASTSSI